MTRGKGKTPGQGGLGKHLKRVAKKERSQPESRKHLGGLEKHKDYVVRAKRRHKKVAKLKEVKRAAAQRNPDEFHMDMAKMVVDMASGKVKKKQASKEEKRDNVVNTMNTNTTNTLYLRTRAQSDLRRVEELSGEVIGLDMPAQNTHTVFVESDDEATAGDIRKFDPVKHFNTTADMLQYPAMRPNLDRLGSMVLDAEGTKRGEKKLTRRQRARVAEQVRAGVPQASGDNGDEEEQQEYEGEDEAGDLDIGGGVADRMVAAQRVKEIHQRARRAKALADLAATVNHQNDKLNKSLNARRNSRFKKGVNVRKR